MEMERKSLTLEIKSIDDSGIFEGYAAAFGNVDSWNDVIEPGAFKASLKEHKKAGTMPALLWQHNSDMPIGIYESMKEDDSGLFVRGRLLKDEVRQAGEAYALLKAKALSGMSIGYWARDYSIDEKTGVRTLMKIDLVEASLVTFPANGKARVTSVKAAGIYTVRDFEVALRDTLGFGREEAKRIASHGFKARDVPDPNDKASAIIEQIKKKYL